MAEERLTEARVVEIFLCAQSLRGLSPQDAARRADLALARYRPLMEQDGALLRFARSRIGEWLLELVGAGEAPPSELSLDFVIHVVWQGADCARPLEILAKALDWKLTPILLALALDARPTLGAPTQSAQPGRAVEVCGWLIANVRPACAEALAKTLGPVLRRFAGDLLVGRDLARAKAYELLAEVALRAPSVAEELAPLFWHALLLEGQVLRDQVLVLCFEIVFVLLSRDALVDGSAQAARGRGFAPMLRFLPRMLASPSAVAQRAAVVGVARLVAQHAASPAFEASLARVTDDECFCDELVLQLVERYVRADAGADEAAAAAARLPGEGGQLSDAEDGQVLADIDAMLERFDEGLLADCAVFVVLKGLGNGALDSLSVAGFTGPQHAQTRRALHELVRRLSKEALRAQLHDSISSSALDLFGYELEPEWVRVVLGMPPAAVAGGARAAAFVGRGNA